MSRVPRNVQLLQQQNDTLHQAVVHSKALTLGNTQAAWAQRDFQRMSARTGTSGRSLGGTLSSNPVLAHDAGLHSALEVTKLARQERLRELYIKEAQEYEAELQAMGLALVKP